MITNDLTHAGQCLDIYLHNDRHIYENCTMKAIDMMVNDGLCINAPEVVAHIKRAVRMAASNVHLYDKMAVTPEDIAAVLPNYCAYIIDCAQFEINNPVNA